MKSSNKIKRIVTSGVLISLAFVLSMIKIYDLPYGGSITLFSMVPIILLSCMYGVKWGFVCGFVNGILQAFMGAAVSKAFVGLDAVSTVLMCLLDYLVAFSVLGLGGMFYGKIKNKTLAASLGSFVAVFARFAAHFLSGWILWGGYAEWWFGELNSKFGDTMLSSFSGQGLAAVYSFCYNGSYMIPELIMTVIGAAILVSVPAVRKQIRTNI
ncbi:MAG: energy-coupled thiamine transporter ThiT [Clostridia bacterium]|nr:energy-coupled thiamine transporter ThiT [Clostridia bacterium]